MGALKASGMDGFQKIFFQKYWAVFSLSILSIVKDFFQSTTLPIGLNDTLITLIPKINNPVHIRNVRPISLCNVLYKTIMKVLTNRMQSLLVDVIGPNEGCFFFRGIYKKGAKGWMVLKVDLEKAYIRLRWDFLMDTLFDADFP
ncbi:hypothetical protein V2J09_023405 [Rumex salicifolius]